MLLELRVLFGVFFFCRDEFLIKMNKIFYNLLF
jgi:hypothetical protein